MKVGFGPGDQLVPSMVMNLSLHVQGWWEGVELRALKRKMETYGSLVTSGTIGARNCESRAARSIDTLFCISQTLETSWGRAQIKYALHTAPRGDDWKLSSLVIYGTGRTQPQFHYRYLVTWSNDGECGTWRFMSWIVERCLLLLINTTGLIVGSCLVFSVHRHQTCAEIILLAPIS